jgi:hypothetical protein
MVYEWIESRAERRAARRAGQNDEPAVELIPEAN